ncbi:VOC family protein [Actinoplanes bogorensis]|uniref:VOC family protein n=1 Tax=Paractinoplanes bogorensis TaxID=1610840 RepID=A0ABS5YGD9_9ACTN|nr:VOC family protein [Actinoplanes bogorensis]MBU2662517.1 VOC family protein [Actinoplanes bogorensis]
MTARLTAICFAAQDPERLAAFWSALLGWNRDGHRLVSPDDDRAIPIRFFPVDVPKPGLNLAHFNLTSQSLDDQQRMVAHALELGGRRFDVGQKGDEGHIVLADPEDNEFCVIEPGNNFLAGTGAVGDLAGDGPPEVGYFWSAALGWPLVWDQDEETAIQSPRGGTKITWGGPPYSPRIGPDRVRFEIEADEKTVAELLALGATRTADGLADPDGNAVFLRTH